MQTEARKHRVMPYLVVNAVFLIAMGTLVALNGIHNPRVIHLALLFALCSSLMIDLDGFNGRYALLAIFLCVYFIFFGAGDLTDIYFGRSANDAGGALSSTEAVILIGGLMLIIGYRLALSIGNIDYRNSHARDWSIRTLLSVGAAIWLVGTYATYSWYVHVIKNNTVESIHAGLSGLGQVTTMGYIFAQMVQPLGILLMTYAWRITNSRALFAVVLGMVLLQVLLGFIIDIKGIALGGGFLVIVAIVFADGRVPKAWLAAAVVFVYLAFPVLQAYRSEVTGNGIARTSVVDNLARTIEKVINATDRVNSGRDRAQNFLERLSLKPSVQMIVDGTANGIPFQHGYTMTPILATFVPRILWSDKPDVPTGRLVNKVFHVTEQEETYISPSHLGELYWNFGWPGVLVGMTCIGAILGWIARFNMAEARTVTRLLVIVVTIQLVVRGFEGSLTNYVVWLRSLAAVWIMHRLFARVPVADRLPTHESAGTRRLIAARPGFGRKFPHLLT